MNFNLRKRLQENRDSDSTLGTPLLQTMSETPDGNILDLILEDLRFYRELNLTVREIRLGELAYYRILRNARVFQEFTPTHCEELFGLPLKRLTGQNPWQRDYLIAESHVQAPKRPNSNNA